MTTEEAKSAVSCSNIVSNLLVLRDEVRETSREEAAAIERIVSDVIALQMGDGCFGGASLASSRN